MATYEKRAPQVMASMASLVSFDPAFSEAIQKRRIVPKLGGKNSHVMVATRAGMIRARSDEIIVLEPTGALTVMSRSTFEHDFERVE